MRLLSLAAAFLFVLMASAEAGYEQGVVAFNRGDYDHAEKELLIAAAEGDAKAQFVLGVLYADGRIREPDPLQALIWQQRAAEQGLTAAELTLGMMYEAGGDAEHDAVRAYRWYDRAAARLSPGPLRNAASESRARVASGFSEADRQKLQQAEADKPAAPKLSNTAEMAGSDQAEEKKPAASAAPQTKVTGGRRVIEQVQEELIALGYDPGGADGRVGPKTRSAIAAFERDMGAGSHSDIAEVLLTELLLARGTAEVAATARHLQPMPQPLGDYARALTSSLDERIAALEKVVAHVNDVSAASYGFLLLDKWQDQTKTMLSEKLSKEEAGRLGKWDAGVVLGDIYGNFLRASEANRVYLVILREAVARSPQEYLAIKAKKTE